MPPLVPRSIGVILTILYRFDDAPHRYEPDFVVRLRGGKMLVIDIKGIAGLVYGDDENRVEAKTAAAKKWLEAVNNAQRYRSRSFFGSACSAPRRRLNNHRLSRSSLILNESRLGLKPPERA